MLDQELILQSLEIVEAVAKLGSIGAAARAIGLSEPLVAARLNTVEAQYGVSLFTRRADGLVPTGFVRLFLSHLDKIKLNVLETKQALARNGTRASTSPLRISAGIRSCGLWVNSAVDAMRRMQPDSNITLDHSLLNLYARLVERDVDIGVTAAELLPENAPGLVIEPLGQWRARFICRREHPLADSDSVLISDLTAYPLVGDFNYPVVMGLFNHNMQAMGQINVAADWAISQVQADSLDALKRAVLAEDRLAIVPWSAVARELSEGSLVELHLAGNPRLYVKLVFAYLAERASSDDIRLFVETVKAIEVSRQQETEEAWHISHED